MSLDTQRAQVLAMLQTGPCFNSDFLNARISRFSARIQELRAAGHLIHTSRVGRGRFRYVWIRGPVEHVPVTVPDGGVLNLFDQPQSVQGAYGADWDNAA